MEPTGAAIPRWFISVLLAIRVRTSEYELFVTANRVHVRADDLAIANHVPATYLGALWLIGVGREELARRATRRAMVAAP